MKLRPSFVPQAFSPTTTTIASDPIRPSVLHAHTRRSRLTHATKREGTILKSISAVYSEYPHQFKRGLDKIKSGENPDTTEAKSPRTNSK